MIALSFHFSSIFSHLSPALSNWHFPLFPPSSLLSLPGLRKCLCVCLCVYRREVFLVISSSQAQCFFFSVFSPSADKISLSVKVISKCHMQHLVLITIRMLQLHTVCALWLFFILHLCCHCTMSVRLQILYQSGVCHSVCYSGPTSSCSIQ